MACERGSSPPAPGALAAAGARVRGVRGAGGRHGAELACHGAGRREQPARPQLAVARCPGRIDASRRDSLEKPGQSRRRPPRMPSIVIDLVPAPALGGVAREPLSDQLADATVDLDEHRRRAEQPPRGVRVAARDREERRRDDLCVSEPTAAGPAHRDPRLPGARRLRADRPRARDQRPRAPVLAQRARVADGPGDAICPERDERVRDHDRADQREQQPREDRRDQRSAQRVGAQREDHDVREHEQRREDPVQHGPRVERATTIVPPRVDRVPVEPVEAVVQQEVHDQGPQPRRRRRPGLATGVGARDGAGAVGRLGACRTHSSATRRRYGSRSVATAARTSSGVRARGPRGVS